MNSKNRLSQAHRISLRCYADNGADLEYGKPESFIRQNHNTSTVLVFSTHTTKNQKFSFGTCGVWINDTLQKFCLFHDDSFSQSKVEKIKSHVASLESSVECYIDVMSREKFVTDVLYPYIYFGRAACVGFDIPFEVSRLAIHYGKARNMQNGFSFKLSENLYHPNIRIRSINGNASFVQFASPIRKKSEKKRNLYRGFFIDVKTLHYSMTNKKCDNVFDISKENPNLDEITSKQNALFKSIQYSINKTITIHRTYQKLTKQLTDIFLLKQEHANKMYSPASIAKRYLEKLGIKPFLQKNPDFSKEVLGFAMSSYYGGRTEVRIRKKPVRVTYLDFTSMYPTMFALLGMNRFLVSEKTTTIHSKEKTQKFLDKVSLEDISKQGFWPNLVTICKIMPDNDILPVRSSFGKGRTQNIGVNYLKSTDGTSLWYSLPDVIASKILTGKTPVIEDAITFVPEGMKEFPDESVELVKDVTVNPARDDFVKCLIQKRLQVQRNNDGDRDDDANEQSTILKIIANAASYGIHIQVNSENRQSENTVYGLKSFECRTSRTEYPSRHFNPIIATFLTSGARLILAASEKVALQNNGYMAYCDTDSVMVSPSHAKRIQNFFAGLNPYNSPTEMFKIEKSNDGKLLDDVWFYGISSKRYVLYDRTTKENNFEIHKYSLHGLGHLLNIDQEQWWHDILEQHYFPDSVCTKYDNKYSISKIAITTPSMLERLYNGTKVKPFDSVFVGTAFRVNSETGKHITPMVPAKNSKLHEIPFMPFSDYNSGTKYPNDRDSLEPQFYWKPLSEAFSQYYNHPESKSSGDTGRLKRLKVRISKSSIQYIGKESHNIEESNVIGVNQEPYSQYLDIAEKILSIHPKDSWRIGISRSNLMLLQKKIKQNHLVNLHNTTLQKILNKNSYNKKEGITA